MYWRGCRTLSIKHGRDRQKSARLRDVLCLLRKPTNLASRIVGAIGRSDPIRRRPSPLTSRSLAAHASRHVAIETRRVSKLCCNESQLPGGVTLVAISSR